MGNLSTEDEVKKLKQDVKDLKKKTSKNPLEKLYSRKECAEYFKISETTLHYWKINGVLKPVGVGGRVFYRLKDMQNAIVELS